MSGNDQWICLIMQDQLEVCMKDWAELADEYRDLELRHKEYREVGHHKHHTKQKTCPQFSQAEILFAII